MLKTITTKKFEKDVKLAAKRGHNMGKLHYVMNELAYERNLDKQYADHKLKGDYCLHRECHIEPDWLLIYQLTNEVIKFVRTGTHADLFKS